MPFQAHCLALCVVILWGFNFVVIRWGIEAVHPITMTALRFLLTALPLVFFIKRPDVPMKWVALYGVLFGAGIWGLVNLAVFTGIGAGTASLLLQLSPFLTVIVATTYFKEVLSKQKQVGLTFALLGFVLFCSVQIQSFNVLGVALVMAAAVFWTLCNVIIKVTQPQKIVSFIAWSSLFVPLPVLILAFAYMQWSDLSFHQLIAFPNAKGWLSIIFQTVITTLLGYGIWTKLISQYGLSCIVPYSLIVPVSGLFFGWVIYQETLSTPEIIGALCVVFGLALLTFTFKQARRL